MKTMNRIFALASLILIALMPISVNAETAEETGDADGRPIIAEETAEEAVPTDSEECIPLLNEDSTADISSDATAESGNTSDPETPQDTDPGEPAESAEPAVPTEPEIPQDEDPVELIPGPDANIIAAAERISSVIAGRGEYVDISDLHISEQQTDDLFFALGASIEDFRIEFFSDAGEIEFVMLYYTEYAEEDESEEQAHGAAVVSDTAIVAQQEQEEEAAMTETIDLEEVTYPDATPMSDGRSASEKENKALSHILYGIVGIVAAIGALQKGGVLS